MKAAIINKKGQTPIYHDVAPPEEKEGMILLDVRASALSHLSKVRAQGTHYSADTIYPKVIGSEGVGTDQAGNRYYFFLPEMPYGSLAEQSLVREDHVVPIPNNLDDVTAAAIANPGMSGYAALVERAKFKQGETVLINGATSSSGRLAVQIAKYLGAKKVIATGRNEKELIEVKDLGADIVIPLRLDESDEANYKEFEELLKDHLVDLDVVVDYLWGKSSALILNMLGKSVKSGHSVRFVNCGVSSGQEHIELPSSIFRSSAIELMGSGLGSVPMSKLLETIKHVFHIVESANLQIKTNPVPLSSIENVWPHASGKPRIVFTID